MNAFYLLGIISTFQHVINIFKLLGDFTFCFRSVYFTTPPLRPGTIQKFGSYFQVAALDSAGLHSSADTPCRGERRAGLSQTGRSFSGRVGGGGASQSASWASPAAVGTAGRGGATSLAS